MLLGVGFLLVLPQVAGFAATRSRRRRSAIIWPLAAVGTVCVEWVLQAIGGHGGRACGDCVPNWIFVPCMMALNLAVGSVLGVLYQRARRAATKAEK